MLRVATKMLLGDRAKYVGLLFGITFTSFLVTFAVSYLCGFLTRGFALVAENPSAAVWVMDPAVESTEADYQHTRFGFIPRPECRRCIVRLAAGSGHRRRALSQRAISVIPTHCRG